jgi:putative FmdB family regulatory protein
MPLYEYKCHSCGETFELIQKFSDAPLKIHQKCGRGPVERLISRSTLKFKGTGWYVTDYASSGNGKKPPAKEGKEGKKESSSSETPAKSETKSSTSTVDKKG